MGLAKNFAFSSERWYEKPKLFGQPNKSTIFQFKKKKKEKKKNIFELKFKLLWWGPALEWKEWKQIFIVGCTPVFYDFIS